IADEDLRIRRLTLRDGLTETEAKNRIASQKPDDFFLRNCHYTIQNNGTQTDLCQKLDSILKELHIETK
ncbi:MAG: dephospho-CoA kinase, partial [Clostridia bacterium]|nr:dephospho-CoA kinase [Clostridia bacterium]